MVVNNSGWPESFGFSIAGDAPVVVVSVRENSVAESAGLHVGDQILEINDKNVQGLSKEQVILVARRSSRIPPSLQVISRIRTFRLQRKRQGYGFLLRDSRPVQIEAVAKNSPAYQAGICPGDMLVQVNGRSVKRLNEIDVFKIIELSGSSVKIKMIAGNTAVKRIEDKYATKTASSRQKKAREFFEQMSYYLTGEEHKKTSLIRLMKRYSKDRDIDRFSRLVSSLLTSEIQRRLLKHIRYFIPARHKPHFDVIVSQNYAAGAGGFDSLTPRSTESSPRDKDIRKSHEDLSGSKSWSRATSTPYGLPEQRSASLSKSAGRPSKKQTPCRLVTLQRESGTSSFGFTVSGYNPVFLRSIDDDGPAERAGLKSGDCIIEINGINVRHASHDSVIQLLKNSGKSPTLLVQWRPLPENQNSSISPIRSYSHSSTLGPRQQQNEENSGSDSALESDISPRNGYRENVDQRRSMVKPEPDQKELLKHLKDQMSKLLTKGEQLVVRQALADYYKDRDVNKLIEGLEPVLDDPLKLQMLHCISRLLPPAAQLEFERLAVEMVARHMENGIIISATATAHEMFDILFRVQGSKLTDNERPRNLVGGLVDVKTDTQTPSASKQISNSNSTGSLGSDLDHTPTREASSYEELQDIQITPVKDTTLEALMLIDEEKIGHEQNGNGSSVVMATAMVHTPRDSKRDRKDSAQKKELETKNNNNNNKSSSSSKHETIEETSIEQTILDEEVFREEIKDDRTRLTEQDIEDLKTELRKAQEEAKKARIEAEERGPLLTNGERSDVGVSPNQNARKPKNLAEEIKEKSFGMEPERLRSISTDDHVVLPGQYPPPGAMPPPPPPPPGPAPPPPPPPPLVGGAIGNAMQLKRINWEKLSGVAIENTVWGKLGSEDEIDEMIDFKELESLFSTKNRPVKEKKTEKKQTSILDSKKTYNLSILLGHLKMPIDEIYQAVIEVDESKLSEPHIRTLLMCAPERPEIDSFKEFSGDPKSLSTSDEFTSKMLAIPKYSERLRAMLFKARFYDRVDEIRPDIDSVFKASEEVKSSKKLMKILEIVLATGNYMNKGNSRMSGASGFKISFLTKLISTKTSDNKSTLLHVIVNTIKNNKSELMDVREELTNVPQAAKVSSQMLNVEISELRAGMKEIEDELKSYESVEEDGTDKYRKVLGKFVKDAEKQYKDLLESYDKMKSEFKATAEFFSEMQITTEDFFGAFAIFLQHFENVKKDVMSEEEKRELQARKGKELEEMRRRRGSSVSSRSRSQSREDVTTISENEIAKGFESIMKKRFPSDDEGAKGDDNEENSNGGAARNSVELPKQKEKTSASPRGAPASEIDANTAAKQFRLPQLKKPPVEETLVTVITETRVSAEKPFESELPGKSPPEKPSNKPTVSDSPLKSSSRVTSVSPDVEPNAFTSLLKRRPKDVDQNAERDRTDPTYSEVSIFSTLPRTKAKPPPPLPKKKKVPPPPVKPKPKQNGTDIKAMTLPRSMSKFKSEGDANAAKGSPGPTRKVSEPGNSASRTWSLSSNVKTKKEMETSVAAEKVTDEQIDSIQEKEQVKSKVLINEAKEEETIQKDGKESLTPDKKSRLTTSLKSNEMRIDLGVNLPTYKIAVSFSEKEAKNSESEVGRLKSGSVDGLIETKDNVNEAARLRSGSVDGLMGTRDGVNEVGRFRSGSVDRPKKPERKITDRVVIKPFEPELTEICDHDDDDYDNIPSDKVAEVDTKPAVKEEFEEPDYALPSFAVDMRKIEDSKSVSPDDETENSSRTENETVDDKTIDNNGPEYDSLVIESAARYPESDLKAPQKLKFGSSSKSNRRLVRSPSLSSSQSSESDSPKSYRKFKQSRGSVSKSKTSPLQKIKGVIGGMRSRSSSDASTTSFDLISENKSMNISPRPILKYSDPTALLNRSHSPHSVTFQDLPVNNDIEPEIIKLSSSDSDDLSEMTIKLPPLPKDPPPQLPPEPVAPPVFPSSFLKKSDDEHDNDDGPPPMPIPYHIKRKQSQDASSDTITTSPRREAVQLPPLPTSPPPSTKPPLPPANPPPSVKPPPPSAKPPSPSIEPSPPSTKPPPPPTPMKPQPPSIKPPPPVKLPPQMDKPSDHDSVRPTRSPLSPTLPHFKPPPPPFLKTVKIADQPKLGSAEQRPVPPPVPSKDQVIAASPSPPPLPPKPSGIDGSAVEEQIEGKSINKPPPPPKRMQSIKTSASYLKDGMEQVEKDQGKDQGKDPGNSLVIDAEFTASEPVKNGQKETQVSDSGTTSPGLPKFRPPAPPQRDISNGHRKHSIGKKNKLEIECPTPPLEELTAPLNDIQIVPPPPSPTRQQFTHDKTLPTAGDDQKNGKPKVSAKPMSMYMVKVLPNTPPLILREDESSRSIYDSNLKEDDHDVEISPKELQNSVQSDESDGPRSDRTYSVSSISSMSFPPLPPESLMTPVAENDDDDNFDFDEQFDESQVIINF